MIFFNIENVAYDTSVGDFLIEPGYNPKNAVDENNRTFVLTYTKENPQLIITLSKIFNIKSIYVCINAGKTYQIDLKHFFNVSDFFSKLFIEKSMLS